MSIQGGRQPGRTAKEGRNGSQGHRAVTSREDHDTDWLERPKRLLPDLRGWWTWPWGDWGGVKTLFLKPLFLWTRSFPKNICGTKELCYHMWVPHSHGCLSKSDSPGSLVLERDAPVQTGVPSSGEAGLGHITPTPTPHWLTFLQAFSRGGFTCGLDASGLCSWERFPPGGRVSPFIFCLNHMDKPSTNKSPVLITPFL